MRIENLEKCVEETIQSLHTNEAFADFISFCGRGNIYQLSVENIFATYHQKPDATFITGFDGWKKMGRFPMQNTGIAVYPFDTSNFFANYSDFVFDIGDTKGREIKPWSMTPEIMDSLMELYRAAKPGNDDNIEYLRNMLFESITGYALNYDTDLWFGEDVERRWNIHSLITDCSLKILCDRCNVKYELQESTLVRYHQYFIKEDGTVNEEILSKCVKAIQITSCRELRFIAQFVVKEKRRIKNEQRFVDRNGRGDEQSNRDERGNDGAAESDRGGSVEGSGIGEGSNIPGTGGDTEQKISVGENYSGISDNKLSGTDSNSFEQRANGETAGSEDKGSEGDIRNHAEQAAEETESLGNGFPEQDESGAVNPGADHGSAETGDLLQTSGFLASEEPQEQTGQLDIFTYLKNQSNSDAAAGNIDMTEHSEIRRIDVSNRFSNELIDQILCAGAAGYDLNAKYAVFNFYSTHWNDIFIDDAIEMIKRHYGGAALGFTAEGRNVSAFYDKEMGLLLSYGNESRDNPGIIVSWEDVEQRVYTLIEECRFLDAPAEILAARYDENSAITDIIYYFFDGFDRENYELPEPLKSTGHIFPDVEDAVRTYLSDPVKASEILAYAKELWERYQKGELAGHWKYACNYERVEHLEAYLNGRHHFDLPDNLDVLVPSFVTNDALDASIRLFSESENGIRFRREIYEASEGGTNTKAVIDLLKSHFGDGGSGYQGYNYDHNAKGFKIRIGRRTDTNAIEKTFTYPEISKRLCNYVKADKLFLPGEMDLYPEWKQDKDERLSAYNNFKQEIEREKEKLPHQEGTAYPQYRFLAGAERKELLETLGKEFLKNEIIFSPDVLIFLSSQQYSREEKENYLHEIFKANADKTYYLKGYDYYRFGVSYSVQTRFHNVVDVNCFPSNYIDTDGWLGTYNNMGISFEEFTLTVLLALSEKHESNIIGLVPENDEMMQSDVPTENALEVSPETEPVNTPDSEPVEEQPEMKDAAISFSYPLDWEAPTGDSLKRGGGNIAAIELLKKIEAENRPATAEEQLILSHYVGWGGLPEWFDSSKPNYDTLKNALTEEEYKAVRATVTDSFYTPRVVLDSIFAALKQFGFTGGNVLEPSMGIGNFYSAMPREMKEKSNLYGVEIDSISGRIAKLLHPNCDIQIAGIENTYLPNNFFDCIIGNVPFGEYKVNDKKFNKENFLIHDYFFAKALELCAPGGLICFVTSKGTLDKKNGSVRKYISEKADFIGAVRLPNTTFADSAHTEVTSDIIFLKKKIIPTLIEQEFESVEMVAENIPLNSYFVSHPEMMLGHMEADINRFGPDRAITYLAPNLDGDLAQDLKNAVSKLPDNIYEPYINEDVVSESEETEASIPADPDVKNYTYAVIDGNLYMRENSHMILQKHFSDKQKNLVVSLCEIRDSLHKVINIQLTGGNDSDLKNAQRELNELYDVFVVKYGYINDREVKRAFCDDVEYPLLCALENMVDEHYEKAKIFTKQTIHPHIERDSVDTAIEALNITVADYGYVNMKNVLALYPVPLEQLLEELRGEIYLNPDKADPNNVYAGYETKEEYLSGDVRAKIAAANIAVLDNERFHENIAALNTVVPKDLDASEIDVKIGSNWISPEDYENFMHEKFGLIIWQKRVIRLEYNPIINTYFIQSKSSCKSVENKSSYGTERMSALEIFENLLNLRQITVKDRIDNPNGSNKAYDLLQKVQYINELNPGRNVVFATGTPISNTMCEMYLMQKYLQADLLKSKGVYHFDAWAANFGETVTAMELSPEGKGYREKTRFGKFTNLPELVTMFRLCADVQMQESLPYLDIPSLEDDKYMIIESEPNEEIKAYVDTFVERAAAIRNGAVDPSVDNMLKICHDAKLVSTDIRMLNEEALPDPQSKLYKCVEQVYSIWLETQEDKGTQVIFSDIGVPNGGNGFNVYGFIKDELIKKGIPAEEICFIHDAKNDKDRENMFQDVRNGVKRVIIGSTEKMGTGTNIQTRLCALHEIDVPWRPSDVEQREGRILRQGNMYDKVRILRYVTKGTFDAYNWSIIENKQKFISQVMTSDSVARSCTDVDEAVLNYAEMKAIASGNPLIKEKMEVDAEVTRLQLIKRSYTANKYKLERDLYTVLPEKEERYKQIIEKISEDILQRNQSPLFSSPEFVNAIKGVSAEEDKDALPFSFVFNGHVITERKKAGELIRSMFQKTPADGSRVDFAEYAGFTVGIRKNPPSYSNLIEKSIIISGKYHYEIDVSDGGDSDIGYVIRIQNCVKKFDAVMEEYQRRLDEVEITLESTRNELEKSFSKEAELSALLKRQAELNEILLEESKDDKQEQSVDEEMAVQQNHHRKLII